MKNIVIAGAVRTPIGKFGGSLASIPAGELGVFAARGALETSGVPADAVDEVIFGNGRQAGVRPNVARQVGYNAGLPVSTPAYTINKACGSSLKAIINAYGAIALGGCRRGDGGRGRKHVEHALSAHERSLGATTRA